MKLTCLALFLTSFCYCFCQTKTPVIKGVDTLRVGLEDEKAANHLNFAFYDIQVLDCRDDTSSVGYSRGKKTKTYVFDTTVATKLAHWIGSYLDINQGSKGSTGLLVCVKKFRASEDASLTDINTGLQNQPINGWFSGVICKMEFFMSDGHYYYPMYRFDSIVHVDLRGPKSVGNCVGIALKTSLEKLFKIDFGKVVSNSRKMNITDVFNYLSRSEQTPILTAGVYKKGVYASFEEFKTNNPSIEQFEYRKGKFGDMLYVKQGDNEFPDRKCWGFSDGEKLYVHSGDKFSELVRVGNTFYLNGTKGAMSASLGNSTINDPYFTSILGAPNVPQQNSGAIYSMENYYYQVDMETGKIY